MGFVISNSSLKAAQTIDTESRPPRVLTIALTISHKSEKNRDSCPVVVRCYLDTDESTQYVARIFDGFEHDLVGPRWKGCKCMYSTWSIQ
ncbi:hypothetical protein C8A03DRAFT_38787 [Achaetomium macrosporum]|uniref:Uncharacterized protein n=1 Tax=Achaetomium macrosporum TaxID=79813 RepID=A0AAN7C2A6_9PEZI|nr:hypothetical protein C8A03DRAFT_38787 [Achaetomium macrosporum]